MKSSKSHHRINFKQLQHIVFIYMMENLVMIIRWNDWT